MNMQRSHPLIYRQDIELHDEKRDKVDVPNSQSPDLDNKANR
jgi:hypothetical protein